MIFKNIEPSERLRYVVKNYLLLHFEFDRHKPVPVKPFPVRPQHTLVFYLRGSIRRLDPETGLLKTFPKIAINGSQTKRFDFYVEPSQLMVLVDFWPGGLAKLLQMPLNDEFLDERIDAEALLNPEISRVYEQMGNASSYQSIIAILDDYLWRKFRYQSFENQRIDSVGKLIACRPNVYSLSQLADEACLSLSQFERRFKQQMGISPKFFVRVNRFYQAYMLKEQNPSLDWLSVAIQTGYNDYQHLVKDFKQFAGATPNSLIQAVTTAPERVLGFNDFA